MKLKAEKTETIKNVVGETKAVWVSEFSLQGGIDLRDYFAAKAMQGIASNSKWNVTNQIENCVRESYRIADAMLAERNKGREEE